MKRSSLQVVPQPKRAQVPYALRKKALCLFRGPFISRELRKINARKWLAANAMLGAKHLLQGGPAKWSGRRA